MKTDGNISVGIVNQPVSTSQNVRMLTLSQKKFQIYKNNKHTMIK